MADVESRSIQSLASRMRLARDNDDGYVLILGAGASLSSNVPSTDDIIKALLEEYGQDLEGSTLDRFDKLWNSADEDQRHRYLEPFLNDPNRAPSPGYMHLAELIKEGFFQLVISFNFDVLLQKALELSNADGLLELVADYDPVDQIEKQIERERNKPKIYQLHGSLRRPSTLKFSADDVFDYPEEVEEIITRQTAKNVIVCGYRFEDLNLIKAFADFGKELWWVNPEAPPRYFKVAQRKRKSEDFAVTSDAGRFDEFFAQLHTTLMRPKQSASDKDDGVRFNPFKFLASHREVDARFLFYRRRSIRKLYEAIDEHRPRSLHFAGKRMVGKTSLIRAGLLPLLHANDSFEPIYIRRCGINLPERLSTKIRRVTGKTLPGDSVEEILDQITQEYAGKHVVLILDQFDNSIIAMGRMERAVAKRTLDALFKKPYDNLTVVAVIADDVHFGEDLYVGFANDSENGYISNNMYQQLQPLTKHQVGRILKFQATRADAGIPETLLERLMAQYDARRFTLAHIETICHLLVARINEDRRVVEQDLEAGSRLVTALNAALLEHDILSYLEDLPVPEEQNLLRNVLLAASNTSRKDIAEYLKDNFARMHVDQIWTPDSNRGRDH